MSILKRTGTGINDVAYQDGIAAGQKVFTKDQKWSTTAAGGTYNCLHRTGSGIADVAYQNETIGKALSTYEVGSIVKVRENNSLVDFLVLSNGYPASGRILLLRKMSYYQEIQWGDNTDDYSNSNIDSWLNSTYLNVIDSAVRSKITGVNIQTHNYREYSQQGPAVNAPQININRKVFLLSATELRGTLTGIKDEGTPISYFNSDSRRATGAGQFDDGANYWTRQCFWSDSTDAAFVRWDGYMGGLTEKRYSYGARPAFTLPSSILVNESTGEVIG